MREIRPSSLEGGVRLIPHPYPYLPTLHAYARGADWPRSSFELGRRCGIWQGVVWI